MDLALANGGPLDGLAPARPRMAAPRRARYARLDRVLPKFALVLVLPAVGNVLSQSVGAAVHLGVYAFLAVWALSGPRRCIEALTLSWLATFLNPAIYTASGLGDMFRWLVIAAGVVSVFVAVVTTDPTLPRAWFRVLAFVLVVSALSVQVSYAVDVSLFKAISFFLGATAVLLAFHITRHDARYWRTWFSVLFAVVVTMGFPLIVLGLGYTRNGRGFQGLTGQPQTYSLFLGPLLAWLVARLIARQERGVFRWGLVAIGLISLLATQGRTGLVAGLAGLGIAGLWWVATGRVKLRLPRAWLMVALFLAGTGGLWVAANWESVAESTMDFLFKGRAEQGMETAFYASRGFLIEASLANFRENPLTGIGFGVASDPSNFLIRRDAVLGLPLGASTEKGFTIVAILEEVGLIGLTAFLVMLVALMRPVFARGSNYPAAVLAVAALMVNFGESVFFAMGGSGMLTWLLIGAARVMAAHDT